MRAVVLCHDDQTRGVLVESVDDSRTVGPGALAERLAPCQERIHKARRFEGAGRVRRKASWFFDNQQVLVFVEDFDRNLCRGDIRRFRRRRRAKDLDDGPRAKLAPRFGELAVDPRTAHCDPFLNLRTAHRGKRRRKKPVQAILGVRSSDPSWLFIRHRTVSLWPAERRETPPRKNWDIVGTLGGILLTPIRGFPRGAFGMRISNSNRSRRRDETDTVA